MKSNLTPGVSTPLLVSADACRCGRLATAPALTAYKIYPPKSKEFAKRIHFFSPAIRQLERSPAELDILPDRTATATDAISPRNKTRRDDHLTTTNNVYSTQTKTEEEPQ